MAGRISDELEGIDLGDARLERRSRRVIEALAVDPAASINAAHGRWADTLAAYRLLGHEAVTPAAILAPHRRATVDRVREQAVVLVVQDTTELDYSAHPPRDAKCLNTPSRRGLYAHAHLAVTPDSCPLGVVRLDTFARDADTLGKADERASLPVGEKESGRWLEGYRAACSLAADAPGTRVVSVADREGDLYDIFAEHRDLGAPGADGDPPPRADFLIRSRVDRRTPEPGPAAGEAAYVPVRAELARAPARLTRTVELPATPKRQARTATLEIRAIRVTLRPPHARPQLGEATLHAVLAEEVGGPGDGTDVSWLLFTSLEIETDEDVLRILDYYKVRWMAEVYFRTLKTGCRVEQIGLETTARLSNALAFYAIIAWRVLHLTHLGRVSPDAPCTAAFSATEWQATWRVMHRAPPPDDPPTLGHFLRMVARLGGHNGRARDLPPGPQAIWTGLRRLADFALAWECFSQAQGKSCV